MNNLLSAFLKVGTRFLLIWVIIHFRNTGELLLSPKMLIRSFSLPNDGIAGIMLLVLAICGAVLVWYYKNADYNTLR